MTQIDCTLSKLIFNPTGDKAALIIMTFHLLEGTIEMLKIWKETDTSVYAFFFLINSKDE